MSGDQETALTAVVTYAHSNPGWTREQAHERQQQVIRFVTALREFGIDADADVFHQNVDWSRWGPRKVAESDFVLIIASEAWRLGWMGSGDELKHRGVRAETDVVRSIQNKGLSEFHRRCRIIMLPGSTDAEIPDGMDGLARHGVGAFDAVSMEALLRDLTNQPVHPLPPLGQVPLLPPAMHGGSSAGPPTNQRERLKEQLAALPEPRLGDGPHQAWFRLRKDVEDRLKASASPDAVVAAASPGDVRWQAAAKLEIMWSDNWNHRFSYGSALVVLHMIPVPQTQVSQRLLTGLDGAVTRAVRDLGLVAAHAGLRRGGPGDSLVVEADPSNTAYDAVLMGGFLGCRVARTGQVSIWYSLARDRMGAVLDETELADDLEGALTLGAELLGRLTVPAERQVAIAAELAQTTLLTCGTLTDLGHRTSATMLGAMGKTARLEPEESVTLGALQQPTVGQVAATIAMVLVRYWHQ